MEWQGRFLHDELWLRSRRVLLTRLQELGLDSDTEAYRCFADRQHRSGTDLIGRLGGWIGADRAAEITAETFLGADGRRFQLRLPFILAFMAEYVDWLALLVRVDAASRVLIAELSALFNLGIVLVDHLGDDGDGRRQVEAMFAGHRLERLLATGTAPEELWLLPSQSATPELRVLAALVGAFFSSAVRIGGARKEAVRAELLRMITSAHTAQLAVSRGDRDPDLLRTKSVTPFMIPPALLLLAATPPLQMQLLELGEHIGEVFWRVDDLLDVGRDYSTADGNLLLSRAGVFQAPGGRSLNALLEGGQIDVVATELVQHARRAFQLLGACDLARSRACLWLEMYILDWMR